MLLQVMQSKYYLSKMNYEKKLMQYQQNDKQKIW